MDWSGEDGETRSGAGLELTFSTCALSLVRSKMLDNGIAVLRSVKFVRMASISPSRDWGTIGEKTKE